MSPTPLRKAASIGAPGAVAPAPVPNHRHCPPSPAAVSPPQPSIQQHLKIQSGSVGAPPTLFSQLQDRRDPAPAAPGRQGRLSASAGSPADASIKDK